MAKAQRVVQVKPINWLSELLLGIFTGGLWWFFVTIPRVVKRSTTV